MRILTLLKQVPVSDAGGMDAVRGVLRREAGEKRMNPHDAAALEMGLRLRDAAGGTLEALSMGPPSSKSMLSEALALGADRAALLSGEAFAGADVLATARSLAAAYGFLGGYDAILGGAFTTDGGTGHTPGTLAALLGIPYFCGVCALAYEEEAWTLWQRLDRTQQRVRTSGPAVFSIAPDACALRMPTLAGRLAARRKIIELITPDMLALSAADCGLSGSPTRVVRVETLRRPPAVPPVTGEASELAGRIVACFGGRDI